MRRLPGVDPVSAVAVLDEHHRLNDDAQFVDRVREAPEKGLLDLEIEDDVLQRHRFQGAGRGHGNEHAFLRVLLFLDDRVRIGGAADAGEALRLLDQGYPAHAVMVMAALVVSVLRPVRHVVQDDRTVHVVVCSTCRCCFS